MVYQALRCQNGMFHMSDMNGYSTGYVYDYQELVKRFKIIGVVKPSISLTYACIPKGERTMDKETMRKRIEALERQKVKLYDLVEKLRADIRYEEDACQRTHDEWEAKYEELEARFALGGIQ